MTLGNYIRSVVGVRVLIAIVALIAVMQVLDMFDVTADIMSRGLGLSGLLYYAALRTPILLVQVIPLGVLVGCLFAFLKLVRESAIPILSASGVSIYRLVGFAAPVAIILGGLHLATVQSFAPRAEETLSIWWASTAPPSAKHTHKLKSMRIGSDILMAAADDEAGDRLSPFTLYRRDATGNLLQRIHADTAVYTPQGWRLTNPNLETIGAMGIERGSAAELIWAEGPPPQDVRAIFFDTLNMTPASARRALAGGAAVKTASFYQSEIMRSWSVCAAALIMLFLAAPVMFMHTRSGSIQILLACLGAGMLFVLVDGMLAALGQSGGVPPLMSAWAAPAIFAAAAASVLVNLER